MHARDVLLVGIWRAVPFKDASEGQKNRMELHNQNYASRSAAQTPGAARLGRQRESYGNATRTWTGQWSLGRCGFGVPRSMSC